jgi:NADH:ubiquinone oxidoreductase subunit 2 (subunit N)
LFPDFFMSNIPYIKQIAVALYWAMIVKLAIDLYYYIRVFKLLFRANNQ